MISAEEAFRQYQLAEARVDRSKEANDRTGQMIAEGQAAHWLTEWHAALVAADGYRLPILPSATTARTA